MAEHLAREGTEVTIVGRRRDVLVTAASDVGAKAVAFDAADPASVTAALPQLPDQIDVLVNAAGANTDLLADAPADELDATRDSWLANFEANVLTAVLVTTALLPRIADGGRIVNLGSVTARSGGGSYGAVKAALEPWTSELAFQLGRAGSPPTSCHPGRPKAPGSSAAETSRRSAVRSRKARSATAGSGGPTRSQRSSRSSPHLRHPTSPARWST